MNFKVQIPRKSTSTSLLLPLTSGELSTQLQNLSKAHHFAAPSQLPGFEGKAGQHFVLFGEQGQAIHLLGLGANAEFPKVAKLAKQWFFSQRSHLPSQMQVALQHLPEEKLASIVEGLVQGATLGRYDIGLYKTGKHKKTGFAAPRASLSFLVDKPQKKIVQQAVNRSAAIATTQSRILDLMNAPGNKAKPETLAKWAKASGKANGFSVKVFNKSQCEKQGLHGLLAVNRGSEYPPAFIIMEYRPAKAGRKKLPTIGLVGKGVTFDTGGLSIKGGSQYALYEE